MPSRSFIHKAFRVLAISVPIVLGFAGFVVPIACTLAWYHGTAPIKNENLLPAVICGLIAGLFVVVFHVKKESTLIPFKNRQDFLRACHIVLRDLGYETAVKADDHLVSWPSFRGMLLGGRIDIQPFAAEARINGPKVFVEILRSRMRLHSHIAGVEQNLRDSRMIRLGDRRFKRIQISLRSTPAQWDDVGKAVVRKLVEEGAEVFCDIHLMAQCDQGIRASFLENSIRAWLQQEHIHAEIQKDLSSWDDGAARPQTLAEMAKQVADVKNGSTVLD
jgi:hypothetical protein